MNAIEDFSRRLTCPAHGLPLTFDSIPAGRGMPWPDMSIRCSKGCKFAVRDGIPRFVPPSTYAVGFGRQWRRYQKTQLDSWTGHPISKQRLERCLGMPLGDLRGKKVLECGCGAGRFTELMLGKSALLVAMDLSDAVDANLKNCGGKAPYFLCQGDINASPLPKQWFDVVVCLGVIQHTPSPEQTLRSLAEYVKPGGMLVVDHYSHLGRWASLGALLSLAVPLRAILKRVSRRYPDLALKLSAMLTAVCDPVRRRTWRFRSVDRVAGRLFPSACYFRLYPEMDPRILYEMHELDTHDQLTDYYKHFRSPEQIRDCLASLGFMNIWCQPGGNGVEARGVSPESVTLKRATRTHSSNAG